MNEAASLNPQTICRMVDLVCLGNPLLDLQANVDAAYLKKYDLEADNAILVEEKHMPIYQEVIDMPGAVLIAGGAAQNTARGAAYLLPKDSVAYIGSVGKDVYSEKLLEANKAAGVITHYQFQDKFPTGKCAALITGKSRSLATDLAAANHLTLEHVKAPEQWKLVEQAKVFYVGGFHFTVCPDAINALGEHAAETNKLFGVNLSAPFIPTAFKEPLDKSSPYWDYLIANESEAEAYASSHGIASDVEAVAKHIAQLPKKNSTRPRVVVITQGLEDTIVAISGKDEPSVHRFPVVPLDQSKIVDTNGAGDAFAAGFVAAQVEGKPLEFSIKQGQWLASLGIQLVGPSYPAEKHQFKQ